MSFPKDTPNTVMSKHEWLNRPRRQPPTFIINNYYEKLNEQTKMNLETILSYKGIEQYDYFENNSITDDLIDMNELSVSFLKAYEKITGISLNNESEEEEER